MKKKKQTQKTPKGRGRAMAFYARPDLEAEIRERAEREGKPISEVIADAIRNETKENT